MQIQFHLHGIASESMIAAQSQRSFRAIGSPGSAR
jgi:hypothetical protein